MNIDLFMQPESSTIRDQLLSEFIPDDVCPLGAQLFMDTPQKFYQVDSRNSKSMKEVIAPLSFQILLSFRFPLFLLGRISSVRVW